jgi:hypothetical protein
LAFWQEFNADKQLRLLAAARADTGQDRPAIKRGIKEQEKSHQMKKKKQKQQISIPHNHSGTPLLGLAQGK